MRTRLVRLTTRKMERRLTPRYKIHNVPVMNHRCAASIQLADFTIGLMVYKHHGWCYTISTFETTKLVSAPTRKKNARSSRPSPARTLASSHWHETARLPLALA